jgi:hypothetical protein
MRTAVLIFGEIRGGIENWKKIKELLLIPNNADVFMHSYYYNSNFLEEYEIDVQDAIKEYYFNKGLNYSPSLELLELFQPKTYLLEKQIDHVDSRFEKIIENVDEEFFAGPNPKWIGSKFVKIGYNAIMSQHNSRKKVIELKCNYENKNNFKYDNVIQTRLDLNILQEVKFSEPLTAIMAIGVHEQMLSGPSEMMNILASLYENAPELYLKYCRKIDHHFMQNEYFLFLHLKLNGIPIMNYNYPFDYSHSRNGLLRFDKTFVENLSTTKQIVFNKNCNV